MYFELRHLRTIRAIHEAGGLARAADVLNMTQSALSHQVKGLEDQAGVELFVRRSKPMQAFGSGAAAAARGRTRPARDRGDGSKSFAPFNRARPGGCISPLECHACFDWLFPVLEQFRHTWPEVDVDIRARLCAFEALPALDARGRGSGDLVEPGQPAGDRCSTRSSTIRRRSVCAQPTIRLRRSTMIEAEDLRDQVLITYPVSRDRLDVFTELLTPGPGGTAPAPSGRTDGRDPDAGRPRTAAWRSCPTG